MSNQLSITNLKTIRTGDSVLVQGKVSPGVQSFVINLGRDASNYLIHFSPRFNEKVVVYNSMQNGKWGPEMRDHHFPFKQGEFTKVLFSLEHDEVKVTYSDNHVFDFKSKSDLNYASYIAVNQLETQSIDIK